jgi:hypothetical protein
MGAPPPSSGTRASIFWALFAGAVAAGTGLRLAGIGGQVLGGDELHAVHAALRMPLAEILTTFHAGDHANPPLTALYRIALDSGLRLSELDFRAPILASGLLLLLIAPLLVRRALGADVAAAHAWLIALSPGLVFYSRIVRAYGPLVLCADGAVVVFYAWLATRRRLYAGLYVLLGAVAIWIHLGAAPFVMAPLAFAALWRLPRSRRAEPGFGALVGVGAGLAAAIALWAVPSFDSLRALVALRRQEQLPALAAWAAVAELQAGSGWMPAAALFWALALLGWGALLRTRRRLAAYGVFLGIAQVGGLMAVRPFWFHVPLMLNRYLLVLLPGLLLCVALGLVLPWRWLGGLRAARIGPILATAAFIALVFLSGPLADGARYHSSFAQDNDSVDFHRPRGRIPAEAVPGFYRALATDAASRRIVEAPWVAWWTFSRVMRAYQEHHGRSVAVANGDALLADPRLALRNHVPAIPAALARADADWVVVHRDILGEEEAIREAPGYLGDAYPPDFRAQLRARMRQEGATLARALESAWGPPEYADGQLLAWRLPPLAPRPAGNRYPRPPMPSASPPPTASPPATPARSAP